MGIKALVQGLYDEASFALEKATWKREVVNLKMELFIAAQRGVKVDFTAIPISTAGCNGNGYIRYYVRLLRKNGTTIFFWYADIDSAERDAEKLKNESFTDKVIGPFPLPKDKNEYFR